MTVSELLRRLAAAGITVKALPGGGVELTGPPGADLDPSLVDWVRRLKPQLLQVLQAADRTARGGVSVADISVAPGRLHRPGPTADYAAR